MAERNVKLVIEYEGTAYSGWQLQQDGKTIQGMICQAIQKITAVEVNLIGAGRTDAGVHALGQVANFRIDHRLEPERYSEAINFYLPDDIRVLQSEETELDFHARFSARARRYRYLVSGAPSAVYRNLRYYYKPSLDMDKLRSAAEMVTGEHDFSPFCVASSLKENNACDVQYSCWRRVGPLLVYEIRADRFLHSMVRSLVGAMLNLATVSPDRNRLNLTLPAFSDIMSAPTGERVAFTAPACGLYLVKVVY